MPPTIRDFIDAIGMVDVHEHHFPEVLLGREVNLLQLFRQSYAGWTEALPYPLPGRAGDHPPEPPPAAATTWGALAPFLEKSGSNSFVRNLVRGVTGLYGDGAEAITPGNWQALDAAVREHHQRPDWSQEALRRARIERVITDPYVDPLLDARTTLGQNYDSVLRVNAFACGWHPSSRDHIAVRRGSWNDCGRR